MYDVEGEEVLGDDVLGDDGSSDAEVVGAARRVLRARGRALALPARPGWRRDIAPGVAMPGVGLEPLPLTPNVAGGVFSAANLAINFEARPQRPFRAERLLASVRRSGVAATVNGITILSQGIFIGTALQSVELGEFDVEFFGPTAFGVRLNLVQAQPGVLVRIACRASAVIAAGDALAVSLMFLGHSIR
jgi:hypothetical protein